jgi:lysophospholipase L1-like esterase
VLGVIALLLALDIGVGWVVDRISGDDDPSFVGSPNSQMVLPDAAAGREEPWHEALGWEITHSWDAKRYHPYLGWSLKDFDGDYVRVSDGVRRSYQAPGAAGPGAVEVLFLGGSSLFGWFQRDQHTIPSEFARLAARDGIPVRVVNRATPAYTNWQESLQLQELLSAGQRPDLAIFYDGANELVSQFAGGPHGEPATTLSRQMSAQLGIGLARRREGRTGFGGLWDAWARVSIVHQAGEAVGIFSDPDAAPAYTLQSPWLGDQSKLAEQRGRYAAAIHARGVEVIRRLADGYGFQPHFFWQPTIYSKRVVKGEEEAVSALGTEPSAWRAATRGARSGLAPGVVDLSTIWDGTNKPLMYDFVHTNELGARIAAEAIYRRVRPQLLEAAGK